MQAEYLLRLTYHYETDILERVPFRNEAYLYIEMCVMRRISKTCSLV